jgi:hypothetical protein
MDDKQIEVRINISISQPYMSTSGLQLSDSPTLLSLTREALLKWRRFLGNSRTWLARSRNRRRERRNHWELSI